MTSTTHGPRPAHRSARQPAGLSVAYVGIWALLAATALAYLGLLAVRPDIAETVVAAAQGLLPESSRSVKAPARALPEVDDLKKTISTLQAQLMQMQEASAARDTREQSLTARIAALEAVTEKLGEELTTPVAVRTGATAVNLDKSATLSGSRVQGTVEEKPAAGAGKQVKAVKAAAQPQAAIQIGSGPSLDALRLNWQLLQEAHKGTLKSVEPHYVEAAGDPPSYTLMAGPFTSSEDAAKACEKLKARKTPCSVTGFTAQPL